MKKILFYLFIIFCVIYIYFEFNQKKVIKLCFSNNLNCDYTYKYKNTRIEDILNDLDKNITINGKTIQNILVKAEYIYVDLNKLELNKNSFLYLDDLFNYLRIYCKEEITVILSNENNIIANNINEWIFKNKSKYDIIISR